MKELVLVHAPATSPGITKEFGSKFGSACAVRMQVKWTCHGVFSTPLESLKGLCSRQVTTALYGASADASTSSSYHCGTSTFLAYSDVSSKAFKIKWIHILLCERCL